MFFLWLSRIAILEEIFIEIMKMVGNDDKIIISAIMVWSHDCFDFWDVIDPDNYNTFKRININFGPTWISDLLFSHFI